MKRKMFVISVLALFVLAISFGEIFSAEGQSGGPDQSKLFRSENTKHGPDLFRPPVNYAGVRETIFDLFAVDFDNDEDCDLAVSNEHGKPPYPSFVTIFKNRGDGGFDTSGTYSTRYGGQYLSSAGYINDEYNDLAVANTGPYPYRTVSILVNWGSGEFSLYDTVVITYTPYDLFSADFDKDGNYDIAVTMYSTSIESVAVLWNQGGWFDSVGYYYTGGSLYPRLFAADFDGDTLPDLAICSQYNDNLSILINNGGRSFQDPDTYSIGNDPEAICGADLDRDGDCDLVLANWDDPSITIFKNYGDGTFYLAHNYVVISGLPRDIVTADFDLDGNFDLAFTSDCSYNQDSLFVWLSDGRTAAYLIASAGPLVASDLNGDGAPDLAVGRPDSQDVAILINCTPTDWAYPLDPPSFCMPPLKVPSDGYRVITLRVRDIYNSGGDYEVTTDHQKVICISNCAWNLPPAGSRDVGLLIDCASQEEFISATITIRAWIGTENEDTIEIPLHAVCSNDDYYECMRDERTQIWKSNQVCSLWVCCNTEQRVWDKRLYRQVLFSSGVIVATTEGTDTVVGRQDFRDTRAYTRDTMIVIQGCMQKYFPAEPCSVQQIRCTKTFICANNLEPPNHLKWWWISINKHILMFHGSVCPEFKKEQIIKYVWINFGSLPVWWPDQTPFADYEDIYLGVFADVDAPSDTGCNGCNTAGYDYDRHIMWQHGYNAATHPEYENYYIGLALTDTLGGIVAALGAQDVLNEEYIYPQGGWGWKDGELYTLAATPGVDIHYPDSVDDRTVVLTADMIPAGSDSNALDAEFILIEALIPIGLTALQAHIDDTRETIIPELNTLGMFDRDLWLCGDCNGDGVFNIADLVMEVSWMFAGGPPCKGPIWVGDVNGDGVDNIADVVYKANYLFAGGPPPHCAGFGLKPPG